MGIIIFLLIIIALAVAPEAILNLCAFVEWIIVTAFRFAIVIGTVGIWIYLVWGRA